MVIENLFFFICRIPEVTMTSCVPKLVRDCVPKLVRDLFPGKTAFDTLIKFLSIFYLSITQLVTDYTWPRAEV